MNPEIERNLWLEFSPLKLIVLTAALALVFFAAAMSGAPAGPGAVARIVFAALAIVWGSRSAARSVAREIRDNTWDGQRLSALGAGAMTVGKLFGTTAFVWLGAIVSLMVIAADTVQTAGIEAALWDVAYWLLLALIAQAVSLAVSLLAIRRRFGGSVIEVSFYQAAGIAGAVAIWAAAGPQGASPALLDLGDSVTWWGLAVPADGFVLASMAVFAGWMIAGCYRLMRLELCQKNRPFVWLVFVAFAAAYAAGYADGAMGFIASGARQTALAAIAVFALTYGAIFVEPKSRAGLRSFAAMFGAGRIGGALLSMQAWMAAFLAAVAIAIALMIVFAAGGAGWELAISGAALGFLARDIALVLLLAAMAERRGDLLALALLGLLYFVMPAILDGLHYHAGRVFFLPFASEPAWLSPAIAWIEAIAVWAVTVMRLSRRAASA